VKLWSISDVSLSYSQHDYGLASVVQIYGVEVKKSGNGREGEVRVITVDFD